LHNTIRYKPPDIAEYNYQEEKIMNHNNYTIRRERTEEYREVEHLVREAFWNVYRPGALEHYVLNQLRNDAAFVPELDFVMEKDGKIIGQNMFMRAVIKADDGRNIPIMTMGPICIAKEYQRQGYGKQLLDYSLEQAKQLGCGALCFEGNINFYGKSGFTFAREFGIRYHDLPEGTDDSFFLCKELIPGYLDGITGEYTPPQGYFVDEAEAEQFDQEFPPKVKLKLPGQLV
jgi:predicted N-acetyltransferase YhbS